MEGLFGLISPLHIQLWRVCVGMIIPLHTQPWRVCVGLITQLHRQLVEGLCWVDYSIIYITLAAKFNQSLTSLNKRKEKYSQKR